MLRSRCLPPSPLLVSSFKLFPLYVPVSPVPRAERYKPCPVGLVLPLGCDRPQSPSLLLLASALSGHIIPGCIFWFKKKRSLHSDMSCCPAKINTPGQPRPHTLSLLPRRAVAYLCGGRTQASTLVNTPCPRTHVEIRGRNDPERRPPKPLASPIHMYVCIMWLLLVSCCHCCCCCTAAVRVKSVQAVASTAATVLLLRLIE